MNRIQKLTFKINNNRIMELVQCGHDKSITISDHHTDSETINHIPPEDMIMLINLYRYYKDNDIKNEWINPNGKKEEKRK